MKKLTLILITILALNLACDDENNDSGNGDDPTNGTPNGTKTPTNGTKTPTPTPTTVDTPENLSSDEPSSTDGTYTLSWNIVDGATTYKLQEGQGDNPESFTEIYSGDADSHELMTKMTGSYSYQVQACDASDTCSDWSDAITVHVFREGAPTLTLSDETRATDESYPSRDGTYTLSWKGVSDFATYKLREGETALELSSDDLQNRTHSISGKMDETYTYQVRACHRNANDLCSDWSDAITVHVFTAMAPTLMIDETMSGVGTYSSRDGDYDLSWNGVSDFANYKLREGDMELDLTPATATAYEARSKPNESYRYQVRACHRNANDLCSDWSGAITVNVFQASAPTWISTVTSSNSGTYTLSWTSAGAFANYELKEDETGLRLTPSTTVTTHEISDKQDGSYTYRVRACHRNDNELCTTWSDLSLTVSIDCRETTPQSSGFRGGGGTKASPYLICNYDQLKKMRDSLTSHYRLGAHIDAIGSRSEGTQRDGGTETCTKYNGTSGSASGQDGHEDTCTGWAPVGTSASNAFTGSLQGAGYTIRNLYISIASTVNRVGLFGETGSASVIQNVGVTDAHIRGDVNFSSSGGLVGWNGVGGSISNSYASGSVTSGSGSRVGGLVGWNAGRIRNSYATGDVTGFYVGGLVGNNNTASISNSYATGSVTVISGSSNPYAGGWWG